MAERIFLKPLTPEAQSALEGLAVVELNVFPFRVGRESREFSRRPPPDTERRATASAPNNELYLWDLATPKHISREHFQIERHGDSGYVVRDRGSACGTLVGNRVLGTQSGNQVAELKPGNVIVIGHSDSPYAFKFVVGESNGQNEAE